MIFHIPDPNPNKLILTTFIPNTEKSLSRKRRKFAYLRPISHFPFRISLLAGRNFTFKYTHNMSTEEIATAFINHYYATLDSNPAGLASLYQAGSTMTIEGQQFVGPEAICKKFAVRT